MLNSTLQSPKVEAILQPQKIDFTTNEKQTISNSKPVVLIGIPTLRGLQPEIVNWLLKQVSRSSLNQLPYKVKVTIIVGKPQNVNANQLVNAFNRMDPKPDYLFKIDDDIEPDDDVITRLLSRNVDFIGNS